VPPAALHLERDEHVKRYFEIDVIGDKSLSSFPATGAKNRGVKPACYNVIDPMVRLDLRLSSIAATALFSWKNKA
jgi:hypothetical protein